MSIFNIPPAQHAWHFIEKSKAMVLLNTLKDADAKAKAQIPNELLEKEYDLRVELIYLQRTIAEQETKQGDDRDQNFIDECHSKQFAYNEQWQALITQFERDYPDYFNLKHQTRLPDITQIRQFLDAQSIIINYLVGKKHIYTCTLTLSNLNFYRFDKPENFDRTCSDVVGYTRRSRNKYFAVAHQLYQLLIKAVLPNDSTQNIKQIIIIPDGPLRDIPFETLLSDEPHNKQSFAAQPYLINQYTISYHYSAALWLYGEQRAAQKPPRPDSFVGFAPVYPDSPPAFVPPPDEIGDLKIDWGSMPHELYPPQAASSTNITIKRYRSSEKNELFRSVNLNGTTFCELLKSEDEIKNIAQLFKQRKLTANAYLHHYATKQNLLNDISTYKYILIAAHNDFNPQKADFSGILLSPEPNSPDATIFTITETYHLRLKNAALVVLSCCDSGRGADIKGEGMMAMNRGLLFSGADQVIYTLFKIPDAESATLMTYLFDEILASNPATNIASALCRAKRRFIQKHPDLSPEHWAGYVLLGG